MKWAQTRLDEHIARVVRYDQQFIKGNRIGEEFGIDRWYAVCMWRDDFQKETCCPHSHRSEETAERCSRRLQAVMLRASHNCDVARDDRLNRDRREAARERSTRALLNHWTHSTAPECMCASRLSWRARLSGLFVVYRGQIISTCGADVRAVCNHDHRTRDKAIACAQAFYASHQL